MKTDFITLASGDKIFLRSRKSSNPDIKTILFVHGLGDSGLAWEDAFKSELLSDYDLLVPDLLGYGDTQVTDKTGFTFKDHVKMLLEILTICKVKDLIIVGHSMGGVITSLLVTCLKTGMNPELINEPQQVLDWLEKGMGNKELSINLLKYVDVEGNLTEADATISGRSIKADKRGNFPKWFKMFKETTQSGPWAKENPMLGHYGKSLEKCNSDSFLQGSRDLNTWKQADKKGLPFAGHLYTLLKLEKVYYFGSESSPVRTREFISEHDIVSDEFQGSGHWMMNDAPDLFYKRLSSFIRI